MNDILMETMLSSSNSTNTAGESINSNNHHRRTASAEGEEEDEGVGLLVDEKSVVMGQLFSSNNGGDVEKQDGSVRAAISPAAAGACCRRVQRQLSSCRKQRLVIAIALLALLTALVVIGVVAIIKRRDPNNVDAPCPDSIRIHFSGEPESWEPWPSDLRILSGGANLQPEKSLFNPALVQVVCGYNCRARGKNSAQGMGLRSMKDRPIDVLYRSANCDPEREKRVAIVRRAVEAANFTFKVGGLCGGDGYPLNKNYAGRSGWSYCEDGTCSTSKIMIADERYHLDRHYLSEKMFVPLEYGAIPAYVGNGHEWLDFLGVNGKCFIDRSKFRSEEAYAEYIVYLLRNPDLLQAMQDEPVFLDRTLAEKRLDYLSGNDPHYTSDMYRKVRAIPGLQKLWNKAKVTVRERRYADLRRLGFLKTAFNISDMQRLDDGSLCADIILDQCCR